MSDSETSGGSHTKGKSNYTTLVQHFLSHHQKITYDIKKVTFIDCKNLQSSKQDPVKFLYIKIVCMEPYMCCPKEY